MISSVLNPYLRVRTPIFQLTWNNPSNQPIHQINRSTNESIGCSVRWSGLTVLIVYFGVLIRFYFFIRSAFASACLSVCLSRALLLSACFVSSVLCVCVFVLFIFFSICVSLSLSFSCQFFVLFLPSLIFFSLFFSSFFHFFLVSIVCFAPIFSS